MTEIKFKCSGLIDSDKSEIVTSINVYKETSQVILLYVNLSTKHVELEATTSGNASGILISESGSADSSLIEFTEYDSSWEVFSALCSHYCVSVTLVKRG